MSHKYRRRSRSRDTLRKYSSTDRSISRSRSNVRLRRSISKGRRSYSKGRRYFPRDRRSISRSVSKSRASSRGDRKKYPTEYEAKDGSSFSPAMDSHRDDHGVRRRGQARNLVWTMPSITKHPTHPASNKYSSTHSAPRPRHNGSNRYIPSYDRRLPLSSYKYESDEFKSKKEQDAKATQEKEMVYREKQKLLGAHSIELNKLVGELSGLSKDSAEYEQINEKIMTLKSQMKELITEDKKKPKRTNTLKHEKNKKIDNRETMLFFKTLPECARGKGNLAKWISDNPKILLPKQIAMLASHGTFTDGAIIQYKTHKLAEQVLNSCKLHGISVEWLPPQEKDSAQAEELPAKKTSEADVDYGGLDD
ncbi:conserved hypothetical protein [Theileria equi strain WA]|uniref:Uncharacterized protein n=1 Tax=Theileria equi strain WA TaxID=1537102 RepID=L1LG26_THEEQ|nr:conserved hypothetical protein [Theileria equi strain WA]EKX74215.1 conserved hypothetical protein [Theileria equi strain WA]|eukprot:XP_004833667.1 conserved hypothetical protein [Theileria equi strain WA]